MKRHLVVDAQGIPLAVLVSAANVHDSRMMLATVDAIQPVANPAADRAGDRTSCTPTKATTTGTFAWPAQKRRIIPRIARCGIEPKTDWVATLGG